MLIIILTITAWLLNALDVTTAHRHQQFATNTSTQHSIDITISSAHQLISILPSAIQIVLYSAAVLLGSLLGLALFYLCFNLLQTKPPHRQSDHSSRRRHSNEIKLKQFIKMHYKSKGLTIPETTDGGGGRHSSGRTTAGTKSSITRESSRKTSAASSKSAKNRAPPLDGKTFSLVESLRNIPTPRSVTECR